MRKLLLLGAFLFCLSQVNSQSGKLDSTYGNFGIVTSSLGLPIPVNSSGKQVLVGPGGSTFIVLDFPAAISKRSADGAVDPGFGFKGFASLGTITNAYAVLQADGKIVLTGDGFAVARLNSNGTPDPTFHNSGSKVPGFDNSSSATSVAVQDDGKIVTSGTYHNNNGEFYFAAVRYTAEGDPDSTFNGNGHVITDFEITWVPPGRSPAPVPLHDARARAVAIQPDGKILVGGFINTGYHLDFAVARYERSGRPDSTFDNDGRQNTEFQAASAMANSMCLQPDGKILLAGNAADGAGSYFAVARYTFAGAHDSSFNGTGRQTVKPLSGNLNNRSIALQSNGKILLTGDNTSQFVIARINADGSHDVSFAVGGTANINFSASLAQAYSMAVLPDDKIMATGYSSNPSALIRLAIVRLLADGSADDSFGDRGNFLDTVKRSQTEFKSSAIQENGKLIVAGLAWNGTDNDFAVARFDINGKPDSTFDFDGVQTTDFGGEDQAVAVSIQADGKIVVSGNSNNRFSIARYNGDGSIDNSFSGDGKLTLSLGFADLCQSAALQTDGKILLGGYSFNDSNYDSSRLAMVRFNSNGTLDNTFSGDGILLADFGSFRNQGGYVAVQNDGKIMLGGSVRLEKVNLLTARYNPDGSADNTYSADGKELHNFGSDDFNLLALVIQDDGKLVTTGYTQDGFSSAYSFVLARFGVTGSRDSSFSNDGYLRTGLGAGINVARAIAMMNDGRIAVAGQVDNHFGIALYWADGLPDSAFGTNGIQKTSIATGDSRINSLVFTKNQLYAAGQGTSFGTFGAVLRYVMVETILPLSFLNLRASLQNNSVFLQWKVATTKHAEKFIIERSADGRTFSGVATVAAQGVPELAKDYSGLDVSPLKTLNYYRVKMHAEDGLFQYSNVVAVRFINHSGLTIFPVPAKNTLYVRAYGEHEDSQITIFNSAGVAVKQSRILLNNSTHFSVDISPFSSGAYNLVIYKKGHKEVRTFIKE